MANEAVILSGHRTPIGALGGKLARNSAPYLAATCIKGVLHSANIPRNAVDEVVFGNAISAGLGQNPARQATMLAGLPDATGAITVNKVCGSGLLAVVLATRSVRLGDASVVIAGGTESMSRAPHLLLDVRTGYRLRNGEIRDSILHDGLTDAYTQYPMIAHSDLCASEFRLSRVAQDDYAVRSYQLAREAQSRGWFTDEIVTIPFQAIYDPNVVKEDEEPARFDEEKLRSLEPAHNSEKSGGTVTAGNASSISDGAAALMVADGDWARQRGLRPWARIVGYTTASREARYFYLAPIAAVQILLDRVGWSLADVDLVEINEAFASVALIVIRETKFPIEKVNIHGGAIALGHPIGCSGARILVTLLHALRRTGGRRGIATICIGGGEAIALAVEMLEG